MNNAIYGSDLAPGYSKRVGIPPYWQNIILVTKNTSNFRVPQGVYTIGIACFGAGGGGASGRYIRAVGGAGGGFAFGILKVQPGQLLPTITIGTGGTGGVNDQNGTTGGTTSVGTLLTATGGGGGVSNANATSVGGTGTVDASLIYARTYTGGSVADWEQSGGASAGSFYGNGSDPGAANTGGAGIGPNSNGMGAGGNGSCGGGASYSQGINAGSTAFSGLIRSAPGISTPTLRLYDGTSAATYNKGYFNAFYNKTLDGSAGANGGQNIAAGNGGPGAGGGYNAFNGYAQAAGSWVAGNGGFGGGGGQAYWNDQGQVGSSGRYIYGGAGGFAAGGGSAYMLKSSNVSTTNVSYAGAGGLGGGGGGAARLDTGSGGIDVRGGNGGNGAVLLFWTDGY